MLIVPPKYGHGSGKIVGPQNYVNKNKFIHITWGGELPHWHQDGVMQFVTFRLNDSLPQSKLNEFKEEKKQWLELHPKPWTESEYLDYDDIFSKIDEWIDAGYGECLLKYQEVQDIIEKTLLHWDEERYVLYDYILMPNHIHMLMIPGSRYVLKEILHSIKSYTAHEINKLLGRKGSLWEKESFDRMIRNHLDYLSKKDYIKHNGDFLY